MKDRRELRDQRRTFEAEVLHFKTVQDFVDKLLRERLVEADARPLLSHFMREAILQWKSADEEIPF